MSFRVSILQEIGHSSLKSSPNGDLPYFVPRQGGGHGIGLTIVKRLSDRFSWPVRIDSTPGVGTRVVVEFPTAHREDLSTA